VGENLGINFSEQSLLIAFIQRV